MISTAFRRTIVASFVFVACVAFAIRLGADQEAHVDRVSPADAATGTPQQEDVGNFEFWSGGRYRLTPGDVIELRFPYVPEFDQTLTVQPDGYVSLHSARDLRAQGRTIPEFRQELLEEYAAILREPVVSIVLKDFEKPYFVAAGEVAKPGKYDLRGATTLTQALAFAGGMTKTAKTSQVIVFRRFSNELVEVKKINVKTMLRSRNLSEDPLLRPGDTVFVPQSALSQIAPFIPRPSIGMYLDGLGWAR
jgi:polysaccharide export outer membrane protein